MSIELYAKISDTLTILTTGGDVMNRLYLRLAWSNLKSNEQFYLPYVIRWDNMSAMMFYTIMYDPRKPWTFENARGQQCPNSSIFWCGRCQIVFVHLFILYEQFHYETQKKNLGL